MQQILPLDSIQRNRFDNSGVYSEKIAEDEDRARLIKACLNKLEFSIDDFNATVKDGFVPASKDAVYLIVLATWIMQSYWEVKQGIKKDLIDDFKYSRSEELKHAYKYISFLRSLVVAHPLGTSQHEKYGFDGDRICVDIRGRTPLDSIPKATAFRIDFDGSYEAEPPGEYDVVLAVYSQKSVKDGISLFQRFYFDMSDVREASNLYVDALNELDCHLFNLGNMGDC